MGDSRTKKLEERIAHEVLLILGLAALALVETTLLITPLGFPPALTLIVVVCRVLLGLARVSPEYDAGKAIRWAFYGGIALDVYAGTPFGSHAFALLVATMLVVLIAGRVQTGGNMVALLAVLLGTLVYQVILALLYHYTVAGLDWRSYALVVLLPSVLITLIPTLPIFYLLRWRYMV
jgi:rod shape-determining protein MreD